MSASSSEGRGAAVRAVIRGRVQAVGFREATRRRALELGVRGWVRNEDDGSVRAHVEGREDAVDDFVSYLGEGPPGAAVEAVEAEPAKVEGHEQFAIRGVAAGEFLVRAGRQGGYLLSLEVGAGTRAWALAKEPAMDPASKRLAVELPDDGAGGGEGDVWDRGRYEQGGRVPWPAALDRGHAVFVLHGERLEGGFALQRTGGAGSPRWLLIKRRDRAD